MGLAAADFYGMLGKLLPAGPAWDFEDGSTLSNFLDAWAQEFARLQASADALVDSADPRSANRLLTDYERIFGLPTTCMSGISQSLQQRRNALVAQMTNYGGQSAAYFVGLAAQAGFTITITEFVVTTVNMGVADVLIDINWASAFQVSGALGGAVTPFDVSSAVDEALAMWGNTLLECLINRYKPAHTVAVFAYS